MRKSYECGATNADKLRRLGGAADINFMVMRFTVAITKLSLILAAFMVVGCSSASKDVRDRVSKGMDKDEVLEELGNPSRSKRVKGADRWSYDQYDGDVKTTTHVYFKSGKVSDVLRDDDLVKQIKELSEQKKTYRKKRKSTKFKDL